MSTPEFGDGFYISIYLFLIPSTLAPSGALWRPLAPWPQCQVTQRSVANPGHELPRLRLSTHRQRTENAGHVILGEVNRSELVNHGKPNMNRRTGQFGLITQIQSTYCILHSLGFEDSHLVCGWLSFNLSTQFTSDLIIPDPITNITRLLTMIMGEHGHLERYRLCRILSEFNCVIFA